MTIGTNGWIDWTAHQPGIADKVYTEPNSGEGIVGHSIEGSIAGALSRFMSTARVPGFPARYAANAAASCMFLNPLVGTMIQMYPVSASTWTSGNRKANTTLWPVESEGKAGTPLNANQVGNMVRLAREWERLTGKELVRGVSLLQHNEVWDWSTPNAGPTACPSDRYAPFFTTWANLKEEDRDMTENEVRALLRSLKDSGELASTTDVLSCVAQIAGAEPNTYSDTARIEKVRAAIAALKP